MRTAPIYSIITTALPKAVRSVWRAHSAHVLIERFLFRCFACAQELQNEVGALLEFRDLVIETFPDLKHKMASMSASNTITGLPASSLASRWVCNF